MSDHARRDLFKAAGAGAVGVVALTPGGAEAASAAALPVDAHRHEILAHVADPRSGRITVMVEGREVEIIDRDLVARLAQAVTRAVAGRD
jgi:hypothetical protein